MIEYDYTVDAEDVIRSVSEEWNEFARDNGAPQLAGVGSSLWNFIADQETRHLYQVLFESVRTRRRSASVPFRCDAPDRRRFMRLSVSPEDDGWLQLVSTLVREEIRPRVSLVDVKTPRSEELLTMCGWCKRVMVDEESWVEAEEAIAKLKLFDSPRLPQISHGICNDCRSSLEASLDAENVVMTEA